MRTHHILADRICLRRSAPCFGVQRNAAATDPPLGECTDQIGLGSLPYVRCPQGVHAPTLMLAARDQSADADDLVKRVLGKTFAESLPHLRFRCLAEVEHPSGRREVRNGLDVPCDDCLFRHRFQISISGRKFGQPLTAFPSDFASFSRCRMFAGLSYQVSDER